MVFRLSGYCLANPGSEYLVYQPGSGDFTLDLIANSYSSEWFDPGTGKVVTGPALKAGRGRQSFHPPFSEDAGPVSQEIP